MILLLACTGAPVDTGPPPCETATTWENFAAGFFASYCSSCHAAGAADRHGAPAAVTFDTEAEARAQAVAIRNSVLTYATMPPGGGLLAEDLVLLEEWLECGE